MAIFNHVTSFIAIWKSICEDIIVNNYFQICSKTLKNLMFSYFLNGKQGDIYRITEKKRKKIHIDVANQTNGKNQKLKT